MGYAWEVLGQETVQVGPFAVQAFPVDHSVPGSLAFLIRTAEG
ncbi:MAG: hypothetical protein ACUVQS_07255 [Candidatus Bipolaricaulaceae bacterium]